MKVLYRTKTGHGDLVITREGTVVTLSSHGGDPQTAIDLRAPEIPRLEYARNTVLALSVCRHPRSILVLGLGGGSIPTMLHAARPDADLDAVEIDPEVPELAERYFHFIAAPPVRVHVDDALQFLEESSSAYDLVVLDAYRGSEPAAGIWSRDGLEAIRGHVSNRGVVAANLLGDRPQRARVVRDLTSLFESVWVIPGTVSRNVVAFGLTREVSRGEWLEGARAIEREIPVQLPVRSLAKRLHRC